MREWLDAADSAHLSVATFDTHVRHPNLPGVASRSAAKKLRRLGCTLLLDPESFYVVGYEGPLLPGELDRARAWGRELASRVRKTRHDTCYWYREIDVFEWLDMVLQQRACLTPKLDRSLTRPERTLDVCLTHTFYPGTGQLERWADSVGPSSRSAAQESKQAPGTRDHRG